MTTAIQTVKTSLLNNGSVLRMIMTSEDVYFIFLETTIPNKGTTVQEVGKDSKPLQWKNVKKEMLWNGVKLDDANHNYDSLKCNPLIGGGETDEEMDS
jgi:hypothetical protein